MKVFLIMPSRVMARGLEGVFHDLGEFNGVTLIRPADAHDRMEGRAVIIHIADVR